LINVKSKGHIELIASLKGVYELYKIFQICLIHDIRLSRLEYFDFINAKKSNFGILRKLAAEGNRDIVMILITGKMIKDQFFPCHSSHDLESGVSWYYCETCVNAVNLIEDLKLER